MATAQMASNQLTAIELDNAIRLIELLSKSHSATYRSTQNACRKIFELKPELKVKLNSSLDVLMDCVDTALAEMRADRDELLREEYIQQIIANTGTEKVAEVLTLTECTSETYQREYLKAFEVCSVNPEYLFYWHNGNTKPEDFNVAGWYDGYTDWQKGASRWADVEIKNYPKKWSTERYSKATNYYTFSDVIKIDNERQNCYAINTYSPTNQCYPTTTVFVMNKYAEDWMLDGLHIDKAKTPYERQAIGYCCLMPTPKPRMFRCTRNSAYRGHDVLGNTDISARQGHYIEALNEKEALAKMSTQFPYDKLGFTVTPWS